MPDPSLHLLTVWNPSYTDDALDAHLSLLLDLGRRCDAGEVDDDDVYVWWGKIRSKNRDGRLPHHDRVVALDKQVRRDVETHLYLTDYRSLYVADVGEVTDEDVRGQEPPGTVPAYYTGHAIDFWFRLWDIRRLVADDTPAVIDELRKLGNTGYHDRPVSLYGGVVDLPLIVFRKPEASWFGDRDALTEGRRWAEWAAAQRSETERMSRELRDNLFGRELWPRLGPTTRAFLASAETVFRQRRDDAGFDLSGAALEYAKAVEVELNGVLFPAIRKSLAGKPPHEREVRVDGRLLDLGGVVPHQTLGMLRNLLEHEPVVQRAVRAHFPSDHGWLLGVLPGRLQRLAEFRNAGAHARVTEASGLAGVRREVLGIGEEGVLGKLVRVGMRGR